MLASVAWALVAASFLLLGLFGYASVTRSKTGMVFGAVITAFLMNAIASQIFTAIEIAKINEFGTFQEEHIQPDMPKLMAGLVMFGWAFFLGGFSVGRLVNKHRTSSPNTTHMP